MAGANRDADPPEARATGRATRRTKDEGEANPGARTAKDGGREGGEAAPWMARAGRRPQSDRAATNTRAQPETGGARMAEHDINHPAWTSTETAERGNSSPNRREAAAIGALLSKLGANLEINGASLV